MSLTNTENLHATLVSVFGVGVLITGESGSGKSECALELIARGHTLVADDAAIVESQGNEIFGSSQSELVGLLEVRGLGICDVRKLYGESSIAERCRIHAVIELCGEKYEDEPERISGEQNATTILGIEIPHFVIGNSNARSLPVIVETAARMIKTGGNTAPTDLIERHNKAVAG